MKKIPTRANKQSHHPVTVEIARAALVVGVMKHIKQKMGVQIFSWGVTSPCQSKWKDFLQSTQCFCQLPLIFRSVPGTSETKGKLNLM